MTMRFVRFEPAAGDRRRDHLALQRAAAVRRSAVDTVEIGREPEMLDDDLGVDLAFRGGDKQPLAARGQRLERGDDAGIDLVLEHTGRVVALAVEIQHAIDVAGAGEAGEAVAQRRTDDPAELGGGGNWSVDAILGVEPSQRLAGRTNDSRRQNRSACRRGRTGPRGFDHFSST